MSETIWRSIEIRLFGERLDFFMCVNVSQMNEVVPLPKNTIPTVTCACFALLDILKRYMEIDVFLVDLEPFKTRKDKWTVLPAK